MKRIASLTITAAVVAALAAPAGAAPAFPESVPLPTGFYPEGIEVGQGHTFYVGSLLDGAIYEGDLRTGEGSLLDPGVEGRLVAGLDFDGRSGLLWGVGSDGGAGSAFLFDTRRGSPAVALDVPGAFLNDLVVTSDAAYITDSFADVLWSIPLDHRGQPAGPADAIPLTGDFTFVTEGALPINLNGIAATPDGETLVAVHTTTGAIYRIDPGTGEATEVDLDGATVPSGDGIVLHGTTLYVVQNFLNQVSVITLDPDFGSGELSHVITSDLFRVPTTAASFGSRLYLVNARFDEGFPPALGGEPMSLEYDVVAVRR